MRAYRPQHARPSLLRQKAAPVVLAGGLTLTAVAADVALTAGSPAAASASTFAGLRSCESSGNYTTNTGNGFYGAYQFDQRTWSGLGLSGRPDQASPATQDAAAARLQSSRGWAPWPSCSHQIGLTSSGPHRGTTPATTVRAPGAARGTQQTTDRTTPTRTAPATPAASIRRPPGPAATALPLFTVALVDQVRPDVRAWQQAMTERGWALTVDGRYGPQSAQATHDFEVAHGLSVEAAGVVGRQVRAALAHTPQLPG